MKSWTKAAFAGAAALTVAMPASAATIIDFTGPFAAPPAVATTASGGTVTVAASEVLVMTSGFSDSVQTYSFVIPEDGTLTFDWTFLTTDVDGPGLDPFGYSIDGTFFALSDDDGATVQDGMFSIDLLAGTVFAFEQYAIAGDFGIAVSTVGNLVFEGAGSVVPEASTWAMMIGGFGLVGGAMRRRSRKLALAA